MRNLLQDADRDRLAAPLAARLAGEVAVAGRPMRALAEAEASPFFAAAANARAAELLLLPGLRERHPGLGDALLDFAMAAAEAAPASRCAVAGGIELRRDDPRGLEVATPFLRLTGDLSRGELRQAAPGGAPAALRHGGNLVEFRIGRRRTCADVEDSITDCALRQEGGRVVLTQVSRIRGKAGLFAAREVEAGTLTLRYEVAPDSPVLRVVASFTAARRLTALRLSTACDALGEDGLEAGAARLLEGGVWRDHAPPAVPGGLRWAHGTPVAHLAIGRAGWPAGAPVLHLRPAEPGRVMSVTAEARRGGELHWLVLRHGPVDLAPGETLTVREERLLAPSGGVEAVARLMAEGAAAGFDLDPRPGPGVVLQAVAAALLLDAAGAWAEPLPAARRAALAGFAARALARLEAGEAEIVDLAGAAVAADGLRRAGLPEAGAAQARLLRRLAARLDGGAAPTLEAQATAVLAFARAAAGGPEGGSEGGPEAGMAAAALGAALGAVARGAGGGLELAGASLDPAAEAVGLGLLARAAGAVVLAAEAGAPLPPALRDAGRELHRAAVGLLRPLVRPREGMLEVLGRAGLSPGPQAAVTLALLAPDRLVPGFGAQGQVQAQLQDHAPA